jgi:hypothetical protein
MGGQLWSKPPWTRVMFRITADTVKQRLSSKGFRSHDLRAATRGSTPSAACRDTRTVTTTSPAALVIVAWELAVRCSLSRTTCCRRRAASPQSWSRGSVVDAPCQRDARRGRCGPRGRGSGRRGPGGGDGVDAVPPPRPLPATRILQAVPKVTVAPLFVIWLGYGLSSKVLICFSSPSSQLP